MKIEDEKTIQDFKIRLVKFCPEFKSVIDPLQIKKIITDAVSLLGYGQIFIHAVVPGQKKVSQLMMYILPPTKGNESLCYLTFYDARDRRVKAASAPIKRLGEFVSLFNQQDLNWLNRAQCAALKL